MIERQCQGLVEIIEPKHTLDLVVGLDAAKERLQQDAKWITEGKLDSAPMGYFICGPVGTGKTFLAECYAGSIGIPCLVLRNFRSKYVGETEGNLEQVLRRAAVAGAGRCDCRRGGRGTRQSAGVGRFGHVGPRVFDDRQPDGRHASIAGRSSGCCSPAGPICCRSTSSGRAGRKYTFRCSIPPRRGHRADAADDGQEKQTADWPRMQFRPSIRRGDFPGPTWRVLSSVLGVLHSRTSETRSSRDDLEQSLREFIPSAQGLEKELQELAAVLECTQLSFLPPEWQEKVSKPGGRSNLQERMVAIRQLIEESN